MPPEEINESGSLEAKSPFELRVNKGSKVSESAIKQALESGDIGFIHSFTTGSAVDGPGMRVVAWLAGVTDHDPQFSKAVRSSLP